MGLKLSLVLFVIMAALWVEQVIGITMTHKSLWPIK